MSADADPKTEAVAAEPARRPSRPRFPAPQLRIHDRQVYVGFGATPLGDGLTLRDLALIVPDVAFPFDIAGSAATRYQKKQCRFGYLDLELDHELVHAAVRRTLAACSEHLASLKLHLRAGRLEGEGQLHAPGGPAPFTFRIGFQPEGTSALAAVFDVRLYGPTPLPAPFLAALLARGAVRAQAVPSGVPFGAVGLSVDPVPQLLRQAVPLRGFRLPEMSDARLARVEPGPRAFHLHFAANARPDTALDEELLTTVEGTRSFAEGEALLAQGDLAAAEAYYLRRGEAGDAPPFAQERLLGLLAARPDAHDLALDLAAAILRSRPGASTALWVQATLRLARGERRAAGESFLKLAALARDRAEEASAFHAFAAAGRALVDDAPSVASRALQDALACRPDDLGCLLALATAADRADDAEGAMHAYRRIAALARDPLQASRARVRLAGLLVRLAGDRPAARLQLDAALRQCPDDPDALLGLAELCQADGEPLRALRALDQLRRTALEKGDKALESRACLRAGATWEEALGHTANALLRYQEAASLAPAEPEPALRLAQLHERCGGTAQALEAWQRALVLAESRLSSPSEGAESRAAAHRARRALARIARDHLKDPAAALVHLEAAAALAPDDAAALRELLPSWRKASRAADVARACELCAAASSEPRERAALLAEAGELLQGTLGKPQRAEQLLEQALLLDADCERALGAMANLFEARADGAALCRFLVRLCELARDSAAKVERLQRLSRAARDLAGDLDLAADALSRALALIPDDLTSRAELCALQRRRGDLPALSQALTAYAGLLESDGQFTAAARALVELASLREGPLARPQEALGLLERALVLAPDDAQVLRALARSALRAGKPAAAREALKALLASLPEGAPRQERSGLLAQLGAACEALGDGAGALEATAAAFADAPGDDELGDRLEAMLASAPGRERDLAAARLARARSALGAGLHAASAGHFSRAAQLFAKLGDARGALAAFQGALDADPDGPTAPPALDALAQAAQASGDALRASELLARRASFEPEARAAARLLYRAGALARARSESLYAELMAKAVVRDDQFPPARASLALLRAAQKDYGQALAHAQAALGHSSAQDPDALAQDDRIALTRAAAGAAREAGDLEAARDLLSRYCADRPGDIEALQELVGLHRRRGDRAQLIALLPRLAAGAKGPLAVEAYRELAALLFVDPARREESARAYRRALELDPDDAASLEGLSALLTRPQEAFERIRLLERLVDLTHEPAQISRLLLEAGEALLGAGHAAKAADAFAKAARAAPEPQAALERLAAAARAAGQAGREASALLDRAALAAKAGEPDAAQRHVSAASRLAQLERAADAERLLLRSLELKGAEPVQRDALHGLVELAEARGDGASAAEHLLGLSALLKGSERAAALLRRAELLRPAGERALARASLEAALEASPGERRAILALKELCAELGDLQGYAGALAALLALPQSDRRAAASLCVELATLEERLGDRQAAEESYRRALSFDRARLDAAQGLYGALLWRGEMEEAIEVGERLAARAPDAKDAARRYAELARVALHGLADRPLALGFARRAYERDSDDAPNAALLAESLYLMGATAEALAVHRQLLGAAALADVPDRARDLRLHLGELAAELGDAELAASSLGALAADEPHWAGPADLLHELLRRRDPAAALEALARHARALSPSRRAGLLLFQLASESRRLGDPAAAARYLALARPCAEDLYALERARAGALREAGLKGELCEALRRVVDLARTRGEGPEALEALDELSSLHGSLGEREREAAALGEAAELAAGLQDPGTAAERLLRRGLILRAASGQLEEAERAFVRSFQLAPGGGQAAFLAADLCARRGDKAGQADLLAAAAPLAAEPRERAASFAALARLRLELEQAEEAEAAAREALAQNPALAEARLLLEELLERQGRFAELAAALEAHAALDLAPAQRAELLASAGRLWRDRAGEPSAAARALSAALALRAGDGALADECAQALEEAGRTAEARALDERLLAADLTFGGAFARQRRRLAADDDAEGLARLLEARAGSEPPQAAAELLLEAARLRASRGDRGGALADERRALELDPASEAAFAALKERLGEGDPSALAQVLLARARAVPAEALELHRSRASLLLEAGDRAEAARSLDEVLLAAPADFSALAQRAELAAELAGPEAAETLDERLLALPPAATPPSEEALARARWRLGLLGLRREGTAPEAAERLEAALAGPLAPAQVSQALQALAGHYEALGHRGPLFRVRMAQSAAAEGAAEKSRALEGALAAAPDAGSERAALAPLCALRPGDAPLQLRFAELLEAAGELEPAARAFEAAAAASPEPEGRARALLRAAAAAQRAGASGPARALRLRAFEQAPQDLATTRACLSDLRESGDRQALTRALALLAVRGFEPEAGAARLELARLFDAGEEKVLAAAAWLDIARRGHGAPGFEEACDRARALYTGLGEPARAAEALAAWASARSGADAERALLSAAQLLSPVDSGAALEMLERASAAAPHSPSPWAERAALLASRGDLLGRARALVEQASRTEPEDERTALLSAASALLWEGGCREESLEALRGAAAARPSDPSLRIRLSEAREAMGDRAGAFAELTAARRLLEPTDARWLPLARRGAALARELQEAEQAELLLAEVFERDPSDAAAFEAARRVLARSHPERWIAALQAREAALAAGSPSGSAPAAERAGVAAERGSALAELGRAEEASEALRLALGLDPQCAPAADALRVLAERSGDPELLAEALEAQAGAAPSPAARFDRLMALGRALAGRAGQSARAAEAYRRARTCASGPEALAQSERALAFALVDASEPRQALEVLASRRADPADARDPALEELSAKACLQAGERAGARGHLLRALELSPDRDGAFTALSDLCGDAPADLGSALLIRARASKPGPTRAQLQRAAAAALLRASAPDRAEAALRDSLDEDPDSQEAFESLASLLEAAGRAPELREALRRRLDRVAESAERRSLFVRLARAEPPAEPARALGWLEQALAGDPPPREIVELLRSTCRRASGAEVAALAERLEAAPWAASGLPALCLDLAADRGDPAEALGLLDRAARLEPNLKPVHQAALRAARAVGDSVRALAAIERLLGLEKAPPERASLHREAFELCGALGRRQDGLGHLSRAADLEPDGPRQRELLARLCALAQEAEDSAALVSAAQRLEALEGPEALASLEVPLGRALAREGRVEEALRRLKGALAAAPDPSLELEVRALADRAGDLETFSSLELKLVAALEQEKPGEAAERLRSLASRLEAADAERAALLFRRAFELSPREVDLERQAALWRGEPARALGPLAQLARAQPTSTERRRRLAEAARAAGDAERADLILSADAFFDPSSPPRPASLDAVRASDPLRSALADGLAQTAVAQLLRAAGPALGQAFSEDPGRRGLRAPQRLGPTNGAALFGRAVAAQRAANLPALEAWLDPGGGVEVALLPGSPDRLVIGLGAAAGLSGAALAFLLLRACELSQAGAAVALEAGVDLPQVVRCVLCAMGEAVELTPAFAARVERVRSGLDARAREALAPLAQPALAELAGLDAAALLDAVVRASARVAMVVLGDAGAALRATARAGGAEPAAMDPTSFAQSSPALLDLLAALLRDDLGALRRSCRGGGP